MAANASFAPLDKPSGFGIKSSGYVPGLFGSRRQREGVDPAAAKENLPEVGRPEGGELPALDSELQ